MNESRRVEDEDVAVDRGTGANRYHFGGLLKM